MTRWVFFGILLAAFSAHSDAAVIEFFDRATFNATVPGVVDFDFETSSGFPLAPAALDFIDASIDLSTPGGDTVVQIQNFGSGFGQAVGGSNGGLIDNFLPVMITFSAPYFAVGFDDLDLTQFGVVDEFAIIDVTFASGTVRYLRTDPDADFSTAPFFGVWSDEAILSVTVWSGETADAEPGGRANLIDNLAISRHPAVPEPASLWLLAAGLVLVAGGRRQTS